MKEIDKLALIDLENGQILGTRSKGKTTFYLPGGKRDPGESDEQALIREIKEELNVDLLTDTIDYLGTFQAQADGKAAGVTVKMTCYTANYDGIPAPTSEIEEIRWLTYLDIDLVSEVDKKIFDFLKEKGMLV
ncbi:MAG: NUDIX domain-containing protein [Cytophagales bacterium]|nr:NUDIX domain-containing protein [Cytophagales bacterium]